MDCGVTLQSTAHNSFGRARSNLQCQSLLTAIPTVRSAEASFRQVAGRRRPRWRDARIPKLVTAGSSLVRYVSREKPSKLQARVQTDRSPHSILSQRS